MHRRQTRRQIIFPVLFITVLLTLLVIALLIPTSPISMNSNGLSIIADFAVICFGILPIVLCSFVVYVGLVAAIYGMNKAHTATAKGMRTVQRASADVAHKTAEYSDKANKQSIELNARFNMLEPILRIFDRPEESDKHNGRTQ